VGADADRFGYIARPKPAGVSWNAAGVFPVPALTAVQVLDELLQVGPGDRLVVNGAGGVTGGLLVSLGSLRGAEVLATAGPRSTNRSQR
jgi:NADPH:quinone reductase-like Zn-dependent oxidoreductase